MGYVISRPSGKAEVGPRTPGVLGPCRQRSRRRAGREDRRGHGFAGHGLGAEDAQGPTRPAAGVVRALTVQSARNVRICARAEALRAACRALRPQFARRSASRVADPPPIVAERADGAATGLLTLPAAHARLPLRVIVVRVSTPLINEQWRHRNGNRQQETHSNGDLHVR